MYEVSKIDLVREKDGKSKNWGFEVKHHVKDLESYRDSVKGKYKATTVLLTYSEMPNVT